MGAPLEFCSKRSVVAILASGVVISLTALTGGIAPAFADPRTEPGVPTITVEPPEPELTVPEEIAEPQVEAELPEPQAPPVAPTVPPAPPSIAAPPVVQAPEPAPKTVEPVEPAPQTVAPTREPDFTPVAPASPTAEVDPPETTVEKPAPRVATPSTSEQAPATSAAKSPASAAPATPPAPVTTNATTSESPTPALIAPSPDADETSGSKAPETKAPKSDAPESDAPETEADANSTPDVETSESSTVSQAAQVIEQSEPQTLEAPKQDVEIAKTAKVVEVKPEPAPKQDVDTLASELKVDLGIGGRDGVRASADAEVKLASARVWDRDIRQWHPDWVQYDEYYRPVLLNPFRDAVRIVYVYQNAPRIVWIPPLARIVLEVAQFAAYSFTAVVATAANIVNAAVNTAVNVAVGSFFGGGYYPGPGVPFPRPPRPVLRYDNVPVQVRYTDRVYEPFRVRRIVDVGDDAQFGERKVLLDGATPAWGVWTQTPTGERQFEVHKTQQFPGLDNPQEAPLPGDYQLRLASDETAPSGFTGRDIFLFVAAGVVGTLGFGAIGLAFWLGRRRPRHV
jgi:hypothetical protein